MASVSVTSEPVLLPPRKRVVATVRKWVEDGRLVRGDLLPTEQALCDQLQVSRGTLRAALLQLEKEGLLEARAGRMRARAVRGVAGAGPGLLANTLVLVTHLPEGDRSNPDGRSGRGIIDISVAAAAREAGKHVLSLHGDALTDRGMASLLADPPLGVIVSRAVADYAAKREVLLRLVGHVPLIVNSGDSLWGDCDRVISDHCAGAGALTRHALSLGRKRILCIWPKPPLHYWVQDRMEGYCNAMRDAGLEPLPPIHLTHCHDSHNLGVETFNARMREVAGLLVDRLIPQPRIDCILAPSDNEAFIAAAACRLCGVAVHEQVMMMGYDNATACPERAYEPVGPAVSIDKNEAAMGRKMVALLLDRIGGKLPSQSQLIRTAPTIVTPSAHNTDSSTI